MGWYDKSPHNLQEVERAAAEKAYQADYGLSGAQGFVGKPIEQYGAKQTTGAEGQAWQGIAQQQAASQNLAGGARGYNPGMMRAAQYAGGEMESRGWGLAEQLRAQQEQQRQGQLMQLSQAKTQSGMSALGISYDQMSLEAQADAFRAKMAAEGKAIDAATAQAIVTGAVSVGSAIGTALGIGALASAGGAAASDSRAKEQAYAAGRADQDAAIRGLTPATPTKWPRHFLRTEIGRPAEDFGALVRAGQYSGPAYAREQERYTPLANLPVEATAAGPRPLLPSEERGSEPVFVGGTPDVYARAQDATMSAIRPQTWQYRPEFQQALGLPPGRHYGPMAQNLERTPIGRSLVIDTPAGKMIDSRMATPALLGMVGRLGQRVDELEGR